MPHAERITLASVRVAACSIGLGLWLGLSGCGQRVVVVPPGVSQRLAEDTEAYVWARDADGQLVKSANKVKIPAGWFAVPPPTPK